MSMWLLNTTKGATLDEVRPVDYLIRNKWLSERIPPKSCVVDFLYHPMAEYWWDHHATTFISPDVREDYRRRCSNLVKYDPDAKSCAGLIVESAKTEDLTIPSYLNDTVLWADKIDSAAYASPEEAVIIGTPAQQISLSFRSDSSIEYHNLLVRLLMAYDLTEVVRHKEVKSRIEPAPIRHRRGLELMKRKCRAVNNVVVYAIMQSKEIVDRMMPYFWHPEMRFSLGYIRGKSIIRVTSNANPWIKNDELDLGGLFARFGGGGHHDVGSVVFPTDRSSLAKEVFRTVCAILVKTSAM